VAFPWPWSDVGRRLRRRTARWPQRHVRPVGSHGAAAGGRRRLPGDLVPGWERVLRDGRRSGDAAPDPSCRTRRTTRPSAPTSGGDTLTPAPARAPSGPAATPARRRAGPIMLHDLPCAYCRARVRRPSAADRGARLSIRPRRRHGPDHTDRAPSDRRPFAGDATRRRRRAPTSVRRDVACVDGVVCSGLTARRRRGTTRGGDPPTRTFRCRR
jgi:hypothetical protein